MLPDELSTLRAGFWRRTLSLAIDFVLAGLVIATVGTALYGLTGGRVQTAPFALTTTQCSPVTSVPDGLSPAPPEGSNFAARCVVGSVPGLPMESLLRVGRQTRDAGGTSTVWLDYALAGDGSLAGTWDLSWVEWPLFLGYLAFMLHRFGITIGMRLTGVRMILREDLGRTGIPLRRLAIRFGVYLGGEIPAVAVCVLVLLSITSTGSTGGLWIMLILLCVALALVWNIVNLSLIVQRQDPIYDRLATVAVIGTATS